MKGDYFYAFSVTTLAFIFNTTAQAEVYQCHVEETEDMSAFAVTIDVNRDFAVVEWEPGDFQECDWGEVSRRAVEKRLAEIEDQFMDLVEYGQISEEEASLEMQELRELYLNMVGSIAVVCTDVDSETAFYIQKNPAKRSLYRLSGGMGEMLDYLNCEPT